MNTTEQQEKSIVVFDDNLSNDWLSIENYAECNDIEPGDAEDDPYYYDWVNFCLQNNWEDFAAAVKKHLSDSLCVVTGDLGLWNGSHEIVPEICGDTFEALEKCFDLRGDHSETVAIEEDGSLSVSVQHHDGCNRFTLHKVAKESEPLAHHIQDWGEDEDAKFSDIKFEKYSPEEFEL